MDWTFRRGLVGSAARAQLEAHYRAYEAGEIGEERICGEMVAVYAGLTEAELSRAARQFFQEEVASEVFAPMLRLVCDLAERGVELWAVSSTARLVVAAGLAEAGFPIAPERTLGAEVAVAADGRLTAEITEVPTGEGKRRALEARGLHHPDAAFGNSVHDGAMLLLAAHPFPVNASPALRTMGAERGWRVFFPTGHAGTQVGGETAGIGSGVSESNRV
jgi:phosphoserine phosphatase